MTTELIKQKLSEALKPELIEIIDNSTAHAGHAGTLGARSEQCGPCMYTGG